MPDANTLTIGIFATLAQHERELISGRTRAALAAKIAQGATLGNPQNLTADAQRKGVAGNQRRAELNENNRRASSMADMMHKGGKTYTAIAAELNRAGFRTSQGCEFQATQVMRLLKRKAAIVVQ
jgi:DNA invertase Pin-like site-specific DNA recombinase